MNSHAQGLDPMVQIAVVAAAVDRLPNKAPKGLRILWLPNGTHPMQLAVVAAAVDHLVKSS